MKVGGGIGSSFGTNGGGTCCSANALSFGKSPRIEMPSSKTDSNPMGKRIKGDSIAPSWRPGGANGMVSSAVPSSSVPSGAAGESLTIKAPAATSRAAMEATTDLAAFSAFTSSSFCSALLQESREAFNSDAFALRFSASASAASISDLSSIAVGNGVVSPPSSAASATAAPSSCSACAAGLADASATAASAFSTAASASGTAACKRSTR
mmetsp:Transcript_15230/g.26650  ORF Transcript_15230/g.26650 Transcript_15230/m.26650 type:complete len:210 (+) Transcript_15230:7476-8105(+)